MSQAQSGPAVEKKKDELEEETLDPNVSASLFLFPFSRIVLLLSILLNFFFQFNEIIQLKNAQERASLVIFCSGDL